MSHPLINRECWNRRHQRGGIIPSAQSAFHAALAFVIVLCLGSCGSGEDTYRSFSVNVINNTDAVITVRYDYNWENDVIIWVDWLGTDMIQPNSNKIIEWSSAFWGSETIEVEYQGKKKLYAVDPLYTIYVTVQDFL